MLADCAFDSRWHTNNCPYFIRAAVTTHPYVLSLSLQKTQSLNLRELRKKRVREKGLNGFLEDVKIKIRQTYQSCEGSCWRIRSRRPGRTAGGWGKCDTPSERCDTDPADPQRPGLTAWSRPSPSCHGMAAGFCNTVNSTSQNNLLSSSEMYLTEQLQVSSPVNYVTEQLLASAPVNYVAEQLVASVSHDRRHRTGQ